ncbi:MAG: DUF6157 family protein [Actinomycetota bacterium]|nr:DUF6157 family protein [Actinomycetota bacterium]
MAAVQYAMLAADPGRWTQEDVLLASSPGVRGRTDLGEQELEQLRVEYFAQPGACLRASPLPKTLGWGLHIDADGRITLHAVDSDSYARLSRDPGLTQLRAMRSKRGVTRVAQTIATSPLIIVGWLPDTPRATATRR